jgi:hypothetical protein
MLTVIKRESTKTPTGAGLVTVDFSRGGVIHAFGFDFRKAAAATMSEAEIEADIGNILIKIDGEPKIEMLASQAIDFWRYYHGQSGALTVASTLLIWTNGSGKLSRIIDRSALAWGTKDIKSITAEIDVLGVATLVQIKPFMIVEPDATRNLGRHLCIRKLADSYAGTGVYQIDKKFPYGQRDINLQAVHIGNGAGTVVDVSVKASSGRGVDNYIYPNTTVAEHNQILHDAKRTVQTGWFHVDFNLINDPLGGIPMGPLTGLSADVNYSVAPGASFPILSEEIRGMTQPLG